MKLLMLVMLGVALSGRPIFAVTVDSSPPPQPWETMPPSLPMGEPTIQGRIEVAGASLWWASFGAGMPVLLLHGGLGNSENWGNQIPALVKQYRVIVMDTRGHGRSMWTNEPLTYHRLAEDVVALLDELKIERIAIVGFSDGGNAALDLAINHPSRVTKLFVFGSNYDTTAAQPDANLESPAIRAYTKKCSADYRRLSPTPREMKPLKTAVMKMWETDPNFTPEQLGRISAVTVCADGEHEEFIRADHVRAMAGFIHGARLLFLPNAGHFAMWQQPDAFNAAVIELLAE